MLGWASLLFVPIGFTPVPFSSHRDLEAGIAWAQKQLLNRWGRIAL